MTLGTRTPSPRVKSSESPPSRPLTQTFVAFCSTALERWLQHQTVENIFRRHVIGDRLPSYRFPIQKQLAKTNHRPTVVRHLPAEDTLFGAPQCILVSEYHSHDLISKIFVISFQLWNTSSVVRVLLCSTARWWVREACHRAGERPCVPTGLVLSGAWHTIQCLAAQPELQASKHFHWIKESSAQTDRQRLNVKVGAVAERCTQTMRFLSVCSFPARGSSPRFHPFKTTPRDRSLCRYLATGGKKDTGLAWRMRGEATRETQPLLSS